MATVAKIKELLETVPTGLVKEIPLKMAKIEYSYDKKAETMNAKVTGTDDKVFEVSDPVSFDLLYYWRTEPELAAISPHDLEADELNVLVAKLVARSPKNIKLQCNEKNEVISVRSDRARQINWKEAMRTVFNGIEKTYKLTPEAFSHVRPRAYNVKLPVATKSMAFYCEIWSGSNIGREKQRAIELRIRGQTIAPLTGMDKPCLNWCTFRAAKYWFDIDTAHIKDVGKLSALTFKTIHTQAGEDKMENIADVFKQQKADVEEAAVLIDKYVHTPLDKDEMTTLISVYTEKFSLPKYVVKDIPDLIKEPTVWGLSNAFSFFRTHCDYKKSKINKEDASLTQQLEHIAGELIVVSPLIKNLKEKQGKITRAILLPDEKKAPPVTGHIEKTPVVARLVVVKAPQPMKKHAKEAVAKTPTKAKAPKAKA